MKRFLFVFVAMLAAFSLVSADVEMTIEYVTPSPTPYIEGTSPGGYLWDVPIGIPIDDAVEALKESSGTLFLYSPNPYAQNSIYTSAVNILIEDLPFEFVASCDNDDIFVNLTGLYYDFFPVPLSDLSLHSPTLFSSIDQLLDGLTSKFGAPSASRWHFDTKYPNPDFDIPYSGDSVDFSCILDVSEKYPSTLQFYWEHVYFSVYFNQREPEESYVSCYLNSSSVDRPAFKSCGKFSANVLDPSFPAISNPDDLGIWEVTYYVDKFKLPTDNAYIRNSSLICGTFNNSATNNSKLTVRFLIDKSSASIMLYEYGDHQVKNSYSSDDTEYNISVLDTLGGQHEFWGYIRPNGDRIYIDNETYNLRENTSDFINILKRGGSVRFYIEEIDREVNQYSFVIEDASGFAAAYDQLLTK